MTSSSNRPFAVITGASSGIGLELARVFAENNYDILIASAGDGIHDAARELSKLGGSMDAIQTDLATYDGVEKLYQRIQGSGRKVDAVAINAGVGVAGRFVERDLADHLNLIQLNVVSPVHLTHRILKDMIAHQGGRILITSSIAGTIPGPYESTYNASKAFLKFFAEAIREELKDTGVTVTTLMPGATDTNFFHRAGSDDTKIGQSEKDDPAEVARQGFDALMEGKDHVVAGSFKNKVQSALGHVLPDPVVAKMHGKENEPGSAHR